MLDFTSLSLQEAYRLFSKERVASYESPKQHFDNLALIGAISQNLGIAEILLRNKIDSIMSGNMPNSLWLDGLPSELKSHIDKSLSKHKIISTQSLGFWLKVIDAHKIHSKLFSYDFLENLNFKSIMRGMQIVSKTRQICKIITKQACFSTSCAIYEIVHFTLKISTNSMRTISQD